MWYEGSDGSRWKIGFASSPNGINNWSRLDQPVIEVGSPDGWEIETTDSTVIYIPETSTYKMWYSSVRSGSASGSDKFRLRYATSNDGQNWNRSDTWVMRGTPGGWDSGGAHRGKTIIFKDGVYHMWFAATNDGDLTTSPFWRIGYATSPDGVNWTKQNEGNPVVAPTELWELNNVSFPTVIFEDNIYRMWYGAGSGDAPTQIAYAYSVDGVHWIKPVDENPVFTTSGGSWDSIALTITSAIHDTDTYRLWYSGFNGTNWKIGLTTSPALGLIPIPTSAPPPTLTRTPTPSPSPTSSPTPTPTPTPEPAKTKKIIVIPGLGASWNADLLFNCRPDDGNEQWVMNDLAKSVYNRLFKRLEKNGYTIIPFYYDWRRSPTQNAAQLTLLIRANLQDGEKVDVIGHSMGGLVARAYVEQTQDESNIDSLLAVGSPFGGSALAYPVWEGGQIATNNVLVRFALEAVTHFCALTQNLSKLNTIRAYAPSVKQLLPIADYILIKSTNTLKPMAEMAQRNEWLPNNFFLPPYHNIRVGTLSGTGFKTLLQLKVKLPNKQQQKAGLWQDGAPVTKVFNTHGDGTVQRASAQLPEADNRMLNLNHTALVANKLGVDAILDFFGITPGPSPLRSMAIFEEPDEPETISALILMAYPASFEVTNPDGSVLKDEEGIVAITNPKTGKRRIKLYPTSEVTRFVVTQLLKNGTTLWKEYKIKGKKPKIKNIIFDEIHPLADPLK